MKGRTLGTIISGADVLAHLTQQAARLMRLQSVFEAGVPVTLARYSRVANYKAGRVVILADNGSVALKLKQLARTLELNFSAICPEITEIDIRVQVGGVGANTTLFRQKASELSAAAARGLSADTATELADLATHLPANSPLKSALNRLLTRTRREGEA